jgi:hypothetical protein
MAAVQLALIGERVTRIPLVADPFRIGRDPSCDLCLWDLRVSRLHARITRARGEWMLSSEGRHGVYLRGERMPVLALRHGDDVSLTPPGQEPPVRLRFENALEGTFVPDGVATSTAWAQVLSTTPREPGTFGRYALLDARADAGAPGGHLARDQATGAEVFLRLLSPVPDGEAADAWLRLVAALGGASHPSLPPVLEAGIVPTPEGLRPWAAMEPVRGRAASLRIAEGPQSAITVVRRLRGLAAALHLLHGRGVVHGGVVASNVALRPDGGATLLGLSRAFLRREGRPRLEPTPGDTIFSAPEALLDGALPGPASDVYGLAAVGRAMLTGGAAKPLAETTAPLPPALERAFAAALADDPGSRPTAEDFGQALAFAEASLDRASA